MFRLINGYLNGDEDARSMLDQYDFYIVPVVNPDGKSQMIGGLVNIPDRVWPNCADSTHTYNDILLWIHTNQS